MDRVDCLNNYGRFDRADYNVFEQKEKFRFIMILQRDRLTEQHDKLNRFAISNLRLSVNDRLPLLPNTNKKVLSSMPKAAILSAV